jgi:uncharacterized protein (TIGR03067 family)
MDRENLQGAWIVTRQVVEEPAGRVSIERLVFRGDSLSWKETFYRDGRDLVNIDYALLSGLSPKGIDLTPTEGVNRGKTYPGIYSLNGDVLTICYRGPSERRPNNFSSKPGAVLITLRREGVVADTTGAADPGIAPDNRPA